MFRNIDDKNFDAFIKERMSTCVLKGAYTYMKDSQDYKDWFSTSNFPPTQLMQLPNVHYTFIASDKIFLLLCGPHNKCMEISLLKSSEKKEKPLLT